MEKVTNWLRLWEQLAETQIKAFDRKKQHRGEDSWKHKAAHFESLVKEKWAKPDSSRQFLASILAENPGSTVLDIGAGTGAWSVFLAPFAAAVTAIEPSDAMGGILKKKLETENIDNIRLVKGSWPDVEVTPHDYVLAAHSMYCNTDFKAFIRKMISSTRKTCFLLLRALFADSIMARATQHIQGQPFDSPNFQVAYNALLQMDIYPNVLMETGAPWTPWASDSQKEALDEIKNRLGVQDTSEHDDFLISLLDVHLKEKDGKYIWPVGNRSALVYWDV
ncbi:MAG: class I SAM-dependent methyltransferase [Desulfobacterales bacterium]|nr:class I SAM-dependent methyltransferase [Desulfobacterales bacterium]MDD4072870.1 class I SAM-dependent methyltransferase [Desulfobacterales bacterium]MDD4392830.1 class I SAM-dependent methyltransferase [Desulfobacterales bacterium]